MRYSKLLNCIKKWVKQNNKEIFKAKEIPCLEKSPTFLPKHRVGNPGGYSEFFIRKARGKYSLKE